MKWLLILALLLAAAFVIDRLGRAADARGWIYWRRRERHPSLSAGLLGAMDEFVNPARYSASEELEGREIRREAIPDAAPPGEGADGRPVVRITRPRR